MLPAPPSRTPGSNDATRALAARWFAALFVWDLALLAGYVLTSLTWRFRQTPTDLAAMFWVGSETSLVTWTSVVTMCALGVLCLALGGVRRERGWQLAGAFFLYLSADDGAMLHERIGRLAASPNEHVYRWVAVVMPVIAVLGLASFCLIWRATSARRGGRGIRARVLTAYALWGAALLLEIGERWTMDLGARWRGFPLQLYTKLVEEGCELIAPAVLMTCVVELLLRRVERTSVAPIERGVDLRSDAA